MLHNCPSVCPSIRVQRAGRDGQNGREAPWRARCDNEATTRGSSGSTPAEIRTPVERRYVERTFRGTKRDASKALAAMVAEVDQRPDGMLSKGTVGSLCREWLAH